MKIYFWGTGNFAITWIKENPIFLKLINEKFFIKREHIPGTTELFYGINVISPSELSNKQFDYICILSSFHEDIKKDLIQIYDINENLILSVKQLSGIIIEKLYLHSSKEHRALFTKDFLKRIVLDYLTQNDKATNEILNNYSDYQYLLKNYKKFANENSHSYLNKEKTIINNTIWICWLQGYKSAPEIVKACICSIKRYMPNSKIILITENNFKEYIEIPTFILEKYKNGIISKTHFSDLIRLELLIKYGGIWMDATVLLTNKIPDYVLNSKLFVFNIENKKKIDPRLASNWFIASESHNNILTLTKTLLYKYWNENDYILNYFFFHYFFRIAAEIYINDWKNLYHMVANATQLSDILFCKFDPIKYKFIKEISFCQKLSYKLVIPQNIDNTFYQKIIMENLIYE